MNSVDRCFARLRASGRKALMPYLTLGYPALDSGLELIPALAAAGADIIEVGIPFSDPIADGPTIQASSHRALENGMSLRRGLGQLATLTQASDALPALVLMTYTNVALAYGVDAFARDAKAAGVSAVILPDMPIEHSGEMRAALESTGLYLIAMMTPNLSDERIAHIAKNARGFIYVISILGVTGTRENLPDIRPLVKRIRQVTDVPLALGFGISTPAQARALQEHVDGIIIGSALIRQLGDVPAAQAPTRAREVVESFAQAMVADA